MDNQMDNQTLQQRRNLRNAVTASMVGTSLDWYDFFLYSTASALIFGDVFFPNSSPAVGTILSFATFGVGFVARPIGAVVFGSIGDRIGRKPTLITTLVLMGVSSAAIGLVPSYASIGIWAPILLVALRLLQGFGSGAEFGGASVFCAEYAPERRRGFFASFPSSALYVGVLTSSLVFDAFGRMPDSAFTSWGWRIPFLLSLVLVAVGLLMRLRLEETPEFQQLAEEKEVVKVPLITTFTRDWRAVLIVLGAVAGSFTATYVYQTYSLSYLSTYVGTPKSYGTTALTVASVFAIIVALLSGALSDRFGRRPVTIIGCLFSAAFAFPFFRLLDTGSEAGVIVAMVGGVGIGVPVILGPQGALFSELFNARVRFSGFSISREVGSILFAGLTPIISAALVDKAGGESWPVSLYVIGACVISLITAGVIKETRPRRPSRDVTVRVAPDVFKSAV